jgi:hypothetical protein
LHYTVEEIFWTTEALRAIFQDGALSQHHGLRKQKEGRTNADLAHSFKTPCFKMTTRRMGRTFPDLTFVCCMPSKSIDHTSSWRIKSTVLSLADKAASRRKISWGRKSAHDIVLWRWAMKHCQMIWWPPVVQTTASPAAQVHSASAASFKAAMEKGSA